MLKRGQLGDNREFWIAGEQTCRACGDRHMAMWPVRSVQWMECPACGQFAVPKQNPRLMSRGVKYRDRRRRGKG